MSSQASTDPSASGQTDSQRLSRLKSNLASLKSRLQGFTVNDRQGQSVGSVHDLMLDSEQNLSLVVELPDAYQENRMVLINSRLIQRVNAQAKSLFVNLNQSDFSYLPEYVPAENQGITPIITSTIASQAPLNDPHPTSPVDVAESRVNDLLGYSPSPKAMSTDQETPPQPKSETIVWSEVLNRKPGILPSSQETSSQSDIASPTAITHIEEDPEDNGMPQPDKTVQSAFNSQPSVPVLEATTPVIPSLPNDSEGVLEVVEEETIPVLEERLIVNSNRRKVGEVVVRKEIETRMVQVPVRREKLIVEQLGDKTKRLAEIDLGQAGSSERELLQQLGVPEDSYTPTFEGSRPVIRGEFHSPRAASQLLDAIAKLHHHRCQSIRIELVLEDDRLADTYREWFQLYGNNGSH